MNTLVTVVVFLLILGVLIFVHELGHYAVAKWTGMRVDEFAIGFPPRLVAWKRGETTYALNLVPFGGYVKIHGENPEHQDDDPRSFDKKSVWARIAVIVAGVTMNLLFAFVILVIAFSNGFVSVSQDLTKIPGAKITHAEVAVADTQPDSVAAKAGIKAGDIIQALKDPATGFVQSINTIQELTSFTKADQEAGTLDQIVVLERDGKSQEIPVTLAKTGPGLGVYISPYLIVKVPFLQAPVAAVKEIGTIIQFTWDALKGFGSQLFHAKLDPNVSGPIGVYQATGAATRAGVIPTIFLLVALSINLALLNILPIPALDGGKLLFLITELLARKRIVARRIENAITFAGFVIIIGLILLLSVRDVTHLFIK